MKLQNASKPRKLLIIKGSKKYFRSEPLTNANRLNICFFHFCQKSVLVIKTLLLSKKCPSIICLAWYSGYIIYNINNNFYAFLKVTVILNIISYRKK